MGRVVTLSNSFWLLDAPSAWVVTRKVLPLQNPHLGGELGVRLS